MRKHTPGPWKTVSVYADTEVRTDSEALVAVVTPVRCESAENARLIAAAPDLLEALRGAVVLFACHAKDCTAMNWLDRAEAALTKAGGELFNTADEPPP